LHGRVVEQTELLVVGRLKDRRPLLGVSTGHRFRCPLARRSPMVSSLDQLVQGRIEEMQFDSDPQGASPEALLVTFDPRPVAPLQNHTLPLGEEVQGEGPELALDAHSEGVLPHITA
jgi:hypothetical protein